MMTWHTTHRVNTTRLALCFITKATEEQNMEMVLPYAHSTVLYMLISGTIPVDGKIQLPIQWSQIDYLRLPTRYYWPGSGE